MRLIRLRIKPVKLKRSQVKAQQKRRALFVRDVLKNAEQAQAIFALPVYQYAALNGITLIESEGKGGTRHDHN